MILSRRALMVGGLGVAVMPSLARAETQIGGGLAFGSTWRVVVAGDVSIARLQRIIEAQIARVDLQMSPYRADSALTQFNLNQGTNWQDVPPDLSRVATRALRIAAQTDGAFDPTVGPIVSRLGFGPIRGGEGRFDEIAVEAGLLKKAQPNLTLDLCGIAKGHALDLIVDGLRNGGARSALVEVGGEVRAIGRHPNRRDWTIAILDPDTSQPGALHIVEPRHLALATSGHAANGLTGPVSTSHIIDPRRGGAASPALRSVSVLAPTAAEADAFATAFCAAGPMAGIYLARRLNVSALFIKAPGAGPREIMTGRFAEHVLV